MVVLFYGVSVGVRGWDEMERRGEGRSEGERESKGGGREGERGRGGGKAYFFLWRLLLLRLGWRGLLLLLLPESVSIVGGGETVRREGDG